MERSEERRYEALSPFELKNKLVELAKHRGERMMLNAGRGNPNWVALEPRDAFFRLGLFAVEESRRTAIGSFGGLPKKRGIAARLEAFLASDRGTAGARLLARGVAFGRDALGLDPDLLVGEWVDGILGDHYPLPPRMLPYAERIVHAHVAQTLLGDASVGRFDLFAVEGATAGVAYLFQSLVNSRLLARGDRIALGTPIFTPYLEVPRLPEYAFETIEVAQDESAGWRYPASEIDKLLDPKVKAFFGVNPSNPTAVAIDPQTLARIGEIVNGPRPDLILITDDVYASFVEGFRSLAAVAPRNTIALYSFSKFWGATGVRLGVVAVHESNALDARIASMPDADQQAFRARYGPISLDPQHFKLIDRMVADSRAIGLNHTAGLSTPQQVQMTLIALDALLDGAGARKREAQALVRRRWASLHRGARLAVPDSAALTRYYATLDIPALARERYGAEFADWLSASFEPIDFVVRLAEERGVVLMDGGGFDAPRMSVRVSLANLPDAAYEPIGRAISEQLAEYHARWQAEREGGI
jgi:aspartate 4-decarboxylase